MVWRARGGLYRQCGPHDLCEEGEKVLLTGLWDDIIILVSEMILLFWSVNIGLVGLEMVNCRRLAKRTCMAWFGGWSGSWSIVWG